MSRFRMIGLFLAVISLSSTPSFAQMGPPTGPSMHDPYEAMQVIDNPLSIELRNLALAAFTDLNTAVEQYEAAKDSDSLQRIKPVPISKSYIRKLDLQWFAFRLKDIGEPAGHDFMQRHDNLEARLKTIISAYKSLPGVKQQLQVQMSTARSISRRNDSKRKKALNLGKEDKWIEADEALHSAIQEIYSFSVWYSTAPKGPGDVSAFVRPYAEVRGRFRPKAEEYRQAEANEFLLEMRAQNTPDFTGLQGELDGAISAVGSTGDVAGQTGPQWLVSFGDKWQQAHIKAVRSLGLEMARHSNAVKDAKPAMDELIASQGQFTSGVIGRIADLISADAAQVTPAEALDRYSDYLSALAQLASLCTDSELAAAVQPALNQLAGRSPTLQADVGVYQEVTQDVMRWRQRVATSFSAGKFASYPALTAEFNAAARRQDVPVERRLFTSAKVPDQRAMLLGPGHQTVSAVGGMLVDKQVAVADLINARDGSGNATSRNDGSIYARFPMPIDLTPALNDLQNALLVDNDTPPLSLEAAIALDTAARGDLAVAGGRVSDIVIEGQTSRLANVTNSDWGLLRLGHLPAPPNLVALDDQYLPYVVVRAEIEPQWWQHKYFYISL